jgi:hypothetical protein
MGTKRANGLTPWPHLGGLLSCLTGTTATPLRHCSEARTSHASSMPMLMLRSGPCHRVISFWFVARLAGVAGRMRWTSMRSQSPKGNRGKWASLANKQHPPRRARLKQGAVDGFDGVLASQGACIKLFGFGYKTNLIWGELTPVQGPYGVFALIPTKSCA